MSSIDFRKNPGTAGVAPVQSVSEFVPTPVPGVTIECPATVAPAAFGVPAVYQAPGIPERPQAPFLVDDENISLEDVKFPTLNIVQKSGEMSNIWTPGQIVFSQQAILFSPEQIAKGQDPARPASAPVEITVFGFQKTRFAEKTDGQARGKIVNTEQEIAAAGGTLSYEESELKGLKLFQPLDTALLFITRPADLADEGEMLFPYSFNNKHYALALWNLKASAQTHGALVIRTAARLGHLKLNGKPCFRSYTYNLATRLTSSVKKGEKFWYYVPSLKPGQKNTPEFLAFMNEVLGFPA